MPFENVIAATEDAVGLIQLNRPKVLNALNGALMTELVSALEQFDADDAVRCCVIFGSARAFSAGADISAMKDASPVEMLKHDWIATWDRVRKITKPMIAAVSGYCLGGGCELAMSCDIILASESAQFAQPEINIGVIPGAGGTQRLPRAIGKSRAMELILTGKTMDAREAERRGLVSRVVSVETYLDEAKSLARDIASKPPLAVRLAKESVNKVYEMSLGEGLEYERRSFYLLFATEDQREGMDAFLNKRKPEWRGK
ncbi:MAG: enoyl-CoA hydratase/isomerase family protein [Chloroflexi bacterium]|nr:enoyl-CoA hydratase/isomerase family protein [Chloroflexota bacterium]